MKIAFIGKICSGKSTLSNFLRDIYGFEIHSFGGAVKKYCAEIFGIQEKKRSLIQDFAQKVKEIDQDVWVKYVIRNIHSSTSNHFVIDDLRFPNEQKYLLEEGFIFIKLNISPQLQELRIRSTYPDNYQDHLNRLDNISESYTDSLHFDYQISVDQYTPHQIILLLTNIIDQNISK